MKNPLRRRLLASFACAAGLLSAASTLFAQTDAGNYPNRPIKILVPFAPGGGSDTLARMLAEKIQAKWGQTVIVENRPGAGGNIGAEAAFRAPPDGYTMLFTPHPTLVVNKFLYGNLNFDPDLFAPVSVMATAYSVLYVNPKLPVRGLQEFFNYAKANPGKLNFASQGAGTSTHLCMELLNTVAGIKTVHVPYKGSAPAVAAVIAGEADFILGEVSTGGPHAQGGRLKMIGVASPKRFAGLPETPAIAEIHPSFNCMLWQGMVAPPGTPPAITQKWAAEIAEITRMPDVVKRMQDMNMLPGIATTEATAAFLREERARWSTVIRTSGAKAD